MRISQSLKDWKGIQTIKDIQHRKKMDAVDCEQLRMDKKATRLNIINEKMKNLPNLEEPLLISKPREENKVQSLISAQEEIAGELANIKREEFKELKLRQQLRESSHELRDLEAKLRTAYVNKDLAAQIREKQLIALHKEVEKCKSLELMRKVEEEQKTEAAKRAGQEQLRKIQYRQDLQRQIKDSVEKKNAALEQFLKDKLLLDDLVHLIHEEDMREEEMRMQQKKKTKEEMDEFKKMRELWRERERMAAEEEDRRVIEFWVRKEAEVKQLATEQKRTKEKMEKRRQMIMDAILETRKRKELEREVLEQLSVEERIAKEEERVRAEMEAALRQRIHLKHIYNEQKLERLEQLKQSAELDEQYRQQMLIQFAKDGEIDRLTKERRRLKILEHRKAVEEMICERQQKRSEEIKALKVFEELERKQIEYRHKMVEDERLRMLQEHAEHLLGYLPKGVLQQLDLPNISSSLDNKQKTK